MWLHCSCIGLRIDFIMYSLITYVGINIDGKNNSEHHSITTIYNTYITYAFFHIYIIIIFSRIRSKLEHIKILKQNNI
jgi:hypothetical protein